MLTELLHVKRAFKNYFKTATSAVDQPMQRQETEMDRAERGLVPAVSEHSEAQSLIDSFTGIMVATVVGGAVAIPVIQDVLNNTSLNGTTATVVSFVPLGIGVSLFLSSLAPIRG